MVDNLASNKEAVQSEKLNAASRQYDLTGNFGTFTDDLSEDEQITIMTAQLNKYNGAMEYYEKLKAEAGVDSDKFNLKLANEAVQLFKLQSQYKKLLKVLIIIKTPYFKVRVLVLIIIML